MSTAKKYFIEHKHAEWLTKDKNGAVKGQLKEPHRIIDEERWDADYGFYQIGPVVVDEFVGVHWTCCIITREEAMKIETCKWEQVNAQLSPWYYKTECGHFHGIRDGRNLEEEYTYCTKCGKLIEVVVKD